MSATLNKVLLIGRLGNDVSIHKFENGDSIANFPVATSENYKNSEGEKVEVTEWHRIIVKNNLAIVCEKYLKKGDLVYLEGKIKSEKWNKDGVDHYSTKILVWKVQFLNSKKSEENHNWVSTSDEMPY